MKLSTIYQPTLFETDIETTNSVENVEELEALFDTHNDKE